MDSLVLERHYASPEARIAGEEHCNFFGHLKNDASACVAVTGCYGEEDMEFTINSRDLETNMYFFSNIVPLSPCLTEQSESMAPPTEFFRLCDGMFLCGRSYTYACVCV